MCSTIRKAEIKNITITNGSVRSRWVITPDVCSSRSMRMVSASRGIGRPVLWWSTPGTLVGQDLAVCEKVSAPDTAGLVAVQGALQARRGHGAVGADALGLVDVGDVAGEEQVGGGAGRVAATRRVPLRR